MLAVIPTPGIEDDKLYTVYDLGRTYMYNVRDKPDRKTAGAFKVRSFQRRFGWFSLVD